MKLTDLAPRWWTDADGKRVGASFACPVHAKLGLDESGHAPCLLSRVYVRTEDVEVGPGVGPRWTRAGDDFATMTLQPSILCRTVSEKHADQVAGHECVFRRCTIVHWHGFVTNGQVSILPDSVGA